MIGFLAPLALFGLALLGIPILLHLFKPKKVRQTPFPTLRWLRASQHRLSRSVKWHQVLLFLLRAAFIVFIVVALAKPILFRGHGRGVAERFIIIDTGRTMDYRLPDGTAPIDEARRIAKELLLQGRPGDRSTVLLAGSSTEALGPLVDEPTVSVSRLQDVRASLGTADLTDALRLVKSMSGHPRPDSTIDLFFITDNGAHKWQQGPLVRFLETIALPVNVHVIDVGPEIAANGWIVGARLRETDAPRRRTIRVQVNAAGDQAQVRTVRVGGLPGLPEQTVSVSIEPDRPAFVDVPVPTDYDLTGTVAQISLEPGDALSSDDRYWLDLDPRDATRVLVIEPESAAIRELRPGFHLRTALDALAHAGTGLRVTARSERAVSLADVGRADVIILAEVRGLSDAVVSALEERVHQGAGAAIFIGPTSDRAFHNTKLFNPLRPTSSLLSVTLGEPTDCPSRGGPLPRITQVAWSHPLLAHLFDPTYGDLAQVSFRSFHELRVEENGGGARTLALVADEQPALVERALGSGRVLLFNGSANDVSNDLPRRKSYVPLIDRMVQYLAGGPGRLVFEAGDAVTVPLDDAAVDAAVTVMTPGGQSVATRARSVAGRRVMQLDNVQEVGVYQVRYRTAEGEQAFPFCVQASRSDGAMQRAAPESLAAWWQPAECRFLRLEPGGAVDGLRESHLLLEPWLMLLACVALLAEMFLVHWLCPKMNPQVQCESVVHRRGFMASKESAATAAAVAGSRMNLTLSPILTPWLILLVCAMLLAVLAYGSTLLLRKKVPVRWIASLGLLRTAAVLVFAACLLQPTISLTHEVREGRDLLVMLDGSASMGSVGSTGRTRLSTIVAEMRSSGFLDTLDRRFTLHFFAFDGEARPLGACDDIDPVGQTTRYADSLADAWSRYRQSRARDAAGALPPGRVVLVSDGIDHGTRDVVSEARRLGLTIDTLAVSPTETSRPEPHVTVVGVQAPRRVLLGSELRMLVTLRQHGVDETPLRLVLLQDGVDAQTLEFSFASRQGERQITLTHRPTSVGIKRYRVALRPASGTTTVAETKPYDLSVQVVGQQNEVLYLQDTWRWDFKFLRRVFESDPSFTLSAFLPRGPGTFMQFGEPDRRVNLAGVPQTKAELEWFDTIILGDFRPGRWPTMLPGAINTLVVEQGGSLIVIAGPNLSALAQVPELASLLPVELSSESGRPTPGPVATRITPEGLASPLFFGRGVTSGSRWNDLPALDQIYAPLRKKPAATVLVEAAGLANAFGNLIVMAEHTVGRGRVIYIGTDTLWKWQTIPPLDSDNNSPFSVFWQQTLRATSRGPLGQGACNVWLRTDRSRYQVGQIVTLRVQADNAPPPPTTLEAALTLPGETTLPLILRADPTTPNVSVAQFEATTAGQYRITATLNAGGKSLADGVLAVDVEQADSELADTAVDEVQMRRIAMSTGGQCVDLSDRTTWPGVDDDELPTIRRTRRVNLWDGFVLPVLLCAVLGCDWLIRLLRGYV